MSLVLDAHVRRQVDDRLPSAADLADDGFVLSFGQPQRDLVATVANRDDTPGDEPTQRLRITETSQRDERARWLSLGDVRVVGETVTDHAEQGLEPQIIEFIVWIATC